MLNLQPVRLEDKQRFYKYVGGHGYRQAEASFANMYIWQKAWDIRIDDDGYALYSSMYSHVYCPFILMPYLKNTQDSVLPALEKCEEYMKTRGCRFYMKGVSKSFAEKVREESPGRFNVIYDENNAEYVYRASDLIELKGKKYHSKRNHISRLLREHTPQMEDYDPQYYDECIALQRRWAKEKEQDKILAENELGTIKRALKYNKRLDLKACVIKIDGQVVAFSVGEQISEDTALIHIEKADDRFHGLYPYLNREFAANYWSHCTYINREEDMGIPGLRKAKRSYHPVFMVDKYSLEYT